MKLQMGWFYHVGLVDNFFNTEKGKVEVGQSIFKP
jgi:hypothetical protein